MIKNIQNQESKGKRVRSEELGKKQEPERAERAGMYVHLGKTEKGKALVRSLSNLLSAVGTAQLAGTVWTPDSGIYWWNGC